MDTATLFMNGGSQAVRLPKKFRLPGTKVFIRKFGDSVILTPYDSEDPWRSLEEALAMFPDDFMADRNQPEMQEREGIFE